MMTPDPDTIDGELRQAFLDLDKRWQEIPDSQAAWTRAIKDAVGEVGERHGYFVAAAGSKYAVSRPERPEGGEWLFDLSWLEMEGETVIDIHLAMESEWVPDSDIHIDFQKLLVARAMHRVMFFWHHTQERADALLAEFITQIQRFRGSVAGDRYLFVYYVGEDTPIQFKSHVKS